MARTLALSRVRFNRPRSVGRSAIVLLALLFVMLRPMCDAFAASGHGHGSMAPRQSDVQASDAAAGGHGNDEICCSSIDGHALAVPAIAPLPASLQGAFAAPSSTVRQAFTSVAKPLQTIARSDPAPPLPYHARSLRRLD